MFEAADVAFLNRSALIITLLKLIGNSALIVVLHMESASTFHLARLYDLNLVTSKRLLCVRLAEIKLFEEETGTLQAKSIYPSDRKL